MQLKHSKDGNVEDLSLTFSTICEYVDGQGRRTSHTVDLR